VALVTGDPNGIGVGVVTKTKIRRLLADPVLESRFGAIRRLLEDLLFKTTIPRGRRLKAGPDAGAD
jgi:hypothetical protein